MTAGRPTGDDRLARRLDAATAPRPGERRADRTSTSAARPGTPRVDGRVLAERLAAARRRRGRPRPATASSSGARSPARSIPVDRDAARDACPASRRRTRRWSASTPRRPASRRPPARSRSWSASAGGRATRSARSSCCCPTTRDEPALLDDARALHPARRLARDLQRPRLRLAAARGPLPAGRSRRRRSTPATSTCCRSSAGCSATGMADARLRTAEARAARRAPARRRRGLGDPGPLPRRSCAAARSEPLADVVRHNDQDVRSLGAAARPPRAPATRTAAARDEAPAGDLAGLARAFARAGGSTRRSTASTTRWPPTRRSATRSAGARRPGAEPSPRRAPRPMARERAVVVATGPGRTSAARRGGIGRARARARAARPPSRRRGRRADRRRAGAPAAAPRPLGRGGGGVVGAGRRPGRTAVVAAIEVAKLREHRLRDPRGALAAAAARPGGCGAARAARAARSRASRRTSGDAARRLPAARLRRRSATA